jgi:hypothetical protein
MPAIFAKQRRNEAVDHVPAYLRQRGETLGLVTPRIYFR